MLSLIIPTSCERDNIESVLQRVAAVRPSLGEAMEVLVVDSASADGTAACAREALDRAQLGRVIEQPSRCSLSQAVLEGIRQARGNLIGVMDADLSHPPELLAALVQAVRAGHEVAIASRYVRGGEVCAWSWRRRALSRLGNFLARPLVPVADATSGYFVCEAGFVKSLALDGRGFKLLLEILVRGRVQRIQEVPYTFMDRRHGASKLTRRVLWAYLRQVGQLYRVRLTRSNFVSRSVSVGGMG